MSNWDASDERGLEVCPQTQDKKMAAAVCAALRIPLHTTEFVREYWHDVFEPFLEGYRRVCCALDGRGVAPRHAQTNRPQGLSPNPDVLCNRHVKFSAFSGLAAKLGADFVATGARSRAMAAGAGVVTTALRAGHYARIEHARGGPLDGPRLLRPADARKDQTYFLSLVRSDALRNVRSSGPRPVPACGATLSSSVPRSCFHWAR